MTHAEEVKIKKLGNEIENFGIVFYELDVSEDAWWLAVLESGSKITELLYALKAGKSRLTGLDQARESFKRFCSAICEARTAFQRDPSKATEFDVYNRLVLIGEEACNQISALAAEVILREY